MGKASYSAEILDDADRVSTQMDWVLFSHEQNARLFGESEVEWRPGEPLLEVMIAAWFSDDEGFLNEIRRRERLELLQPRDDSEISESRCDLCDVSWAGPDPCFICGERRMDEPYFRFTTSTSASWKAARWEKADKHERQEHKRILRVLNGEESLTDLLDYAMGDAAMVDRIWGASIPRISGRMPAAPRYQHPQAGLRSVPMPGTHSPEYEGSCGFIRRSMEQSRNSIRIMSVPPGGLSLAYRGYDEPRPEALIEVTTTTLEVMTFFGMAPFVGDPQLQQGRYVWMAAVDNEGRYVAAEEVWLDIYWTVPPRPVVGNRTWIQLRTGESESDWLELGNVQEGLTDIQIEENDNER